MGKLKTMKETPYWSYEQYGEVYTVDAEVMERSVRQWWDEWTFDPDNEPGDRI